MDTAIKALEPILGAIAIAVILAILFLPTLIPRVNKNSYEYREQSHKQRYVKHIVDESRGDDNRGMHRNSDSELGGILYHGVMYDSGGNPIDSSYQEIKYNKDVDDTGL